MPTPARLLLLCPLVCADRKKCNEFLKERLFIIFLRKFHSISTHPPCFSTTIFLIFSKQTALFLALETGKIKGLKVLNKFEV